MLRVWVVLVSFNHDLWAVTCILYLSNHIMKCNDVIIHIIKKDNLLTKPVHETSVAKGITAIEGLNFTGTASIRENYENYLCCFRISMFTSYLPAHNIFKIKLVVCFVQCMKQSYNMRFWSLREKRPFVSELSCRGSFINTTCFSQDSLVFIVSVVAKGPIFTIYGPNYFISISLWCIFHLKLIKNLFLWRWMLGILLQFEISHVSVSDWEVWSLIYTHISIKKATSHIVRISWMCP